MENREQVIRDHAYRIWEQEGRPEGRQQEHWVQAERELEARRMDDAGSTVEADRARPKASKRSTKGSDGSTPKKPKGPRTMAAPTSRKRKPATVVH